MVMRTCACGCGEAVPPMTRVGPDRGVKSRWVQQRYVRFHHRRGAVCPEASKVASSRAQRARQVRSAPVVEVLRAKGWNANRMAKALGVPHQNVYDSWGREFMLRETAERMLALAAGRPRTPTLREQRMADREWQKRYEKASPLEREEMAEFMPKVMRATAAKRAQRQRVAS